MAKKNHDEPEGMRLSTLATTFTAARAVCTVFPMGTISTYQQLKNRLLAVSKSKDELKQLFDALDSLNNESRVLGLTTLVRPADHPLYTRSAYASTKDQG
jgi:hypothetical protein